MRRFVSAFFALSLNLFPTNALAEAPFWGQQPKLIFVAKTGFSGESALQFLCAEVTDTFAFSLPIKRQYGDYVFSSNRCITPDITPIPKDRFELFQQAGIIPAHLPATPDVPFAWPSETKKLVTFLVLVFFLGLALVLRHWRTTQKRKGQISGDPLFYDVLASVMFHTARTDGVVEKSDLDVIRTAYLDLTGVPLAADLMATKFTEVLSDDTVVNLAKSYRGREAEVLIDAAIVIATRNGSTTHKNMTLLTNLNKAMARDPSWFQQAMSTSKSIPLASQA